MTGGVATSPHRAFFDHMMGRIDALDPGGLAGSFTANGVFRLGNNPAVTGRPAIRDFGAGFFASIGGISHQVENCWTVGEDRAFCNGLVTYTRRDGSELTVPWSTVSHFDGDKLAEYFIYVDASELFSPS